MRIVLHATRKGRQVVNIAFVVAGRGSTIQAVSSINNEFMNLWFHEFMNFIRREAPIEFFG
jgi:hypothetical protein